MDDIINISGLWTRTDKNGLDYYVGKLTRTSRLMVFKNKKKNSENSPDFYLCMCKNEDKQYEEKPNLTSELQPLDQAYQDVF